MGWNSRSKYRSKVANFHVKSEAEAGLFLKGWWILVAHVDEHFPFSVVVLAPNVQVFTMLSLRLLLIILPAEGIGSPGPAQLSRLRYMGFLRFPAEHSRPLYGLHATVDIVPATYGKSTIGEQQGIFMQIEPEGFGGAEFERALANC